MEITQTKARTARERLEELTNSPNILITHVYALAETVSFERGIKPGYKFYPDGYEAETDTSPSWHFLYMDGIGRAKVVYYQLVEDSKKSTTSEVKTQ